MERSCLDQNIDLSLEKQKAGTIFAHGRSTGQREKERGWYLERVADVDTRQVAISIIGGKVRGSWNLTCERRQTAIGNYLRKVHLPDNWTTTTTCNTVHETIVSLSLVRREEEFKHLWCSDESMSLSVVGYERTTDSG